MGLTGNFGALTLDGEKLTVSGVSSSTAEYELVSRDVAVSQNGHITHGAAPNLGPPGDAATNRDQTQQWKTDQPLRAAEFEVGDALAQGFETYFIRQGVPVPTYMTFTWSQVLPITGS
jgi:hypothetical protein